MVKTAAAMMSPSLVLYLRTLWRVEAATALCLALFAVGLILFLAARAYLYAPGPPSWEIVRMIFAITLISGIGPATLFFAPIYSFLSQRGRASFPIAALIGAIPAAAFHFVEPLLWSYALVGGVVVALGAHAIMRKWRAMMSRT